MDVAHLHIEDVDQKAWIQQQLEATKNAEPLSADNKKQILKQLCNTECLDTFLQNNFAQQTSLRLDGANILLPAIEAALETATETGLHKAVIALAHKGRFNLLSHLLNKPKSEFFAEIQDIACDVNKTPSHYDVPYQSGGSAVRNIANQKITLSVNPNSTPLEYVHAVVLGRVCAKQQKRVLQKTNLMQARTEIMPLLVHEESAMTHDNALCFSQHSGFETGGAIHFVISNVDTNDDTCANIAKTYQAPLFRAAATDVENVITVTKLAAAFRQKFLCHVIVQIFCASKPSTNTPATKTLTTAQLYAQQLITENVISLSETQSYITDSTTLLTTDFNKADAHTPKNDFSFKENWQGFSLAQGEERAGVTGVDVNILRKIGDALYHIPDDCALPPKTIKQSQAKGDMIATGRGINWSTAIDLAMATLINEGTHVRHTRQLNEYDNSSTIFQNIENARGSFEAQNTSISTHNVLGFEYGFSLDCPKNLVLFQPPFGDYINGAQTIIDQFIMCAESKWQRMSGLTLLLPHGQEGQGADHSSAYLERFLQMAADDNVQIATCTTPANIFHILRRQIKRNFRKPLILMMPKAFSQLNFCLSSIDEFDVGSTFHRLLPDSEPNVEKDKLINRVILCSGKIYYDLLAERTARNMQNIALIRLEQLYPFPSRPLSNELIRYPKASVVWCQEEAENKGAWSFLERKIEKILFDINHTSKRVQYAGRALSATNTCSSLKQHNREQKALIEKALTGFDFKL